MNKLKYILTLSKQKSIVTKSNTIKHQIKGGAVFYSEYLQGSHWEELKKKHYSKHKNKTCIICQTDKNLDVHHRTYKTIKNRSIIGRENIGHLVTLCRECHEGIHRHFGNTKQWNKYFMNIKHYYTMTGNIDMAISKFFMKHPIIRQNVIKRIELSVDVTKR